MLTVGRLARFAALTLLVFGACSSEGGTADESSDDHGETIGDAEEGEISRAEPGHLEVRVEGDLDIDFEEDLDIRIVVIRNPDVTAVRFLSVGIEQLQTLPDGTAFRVAFDLAGVFDGKGDYELPKVGGTAAPDLDDPDSAVQGISKPFLIFSPAGQFDDDPEALAQVRSFENALEKCTLEVRADDGGAGTLECPEVTDTKGEGRISLRMTWDTR